MLCCALNVQAGRHTLKKPFMNRSFLISFLFLLLYFLNTIYLTSKTLINSQLRVLFYRFPQCITVVCTACTFSKWIESRREKISFFLLLFDYVSCATCSLILLEFFTLFTAHIKKVHKIYTFFFLQFSNIFRLISEWYYKKWVLC